MTRGWGTGMLATLASCAAFATSGPVGKSLMAADWSPGLVVWLRITIAALAVVPFAAWAVRDSWRTLLPALPPAVLYGALAVAMAQLGYFGAVARLQVGVALLTEYSGIALVVLWTWATTRRAPSPLTGLGMLLAVAGLVLVLNLTGASLPDPIGIAWGLLAASGMAGHFLIASRPTTLPPIAFSAVGLLSGSVTLAVLGAVGAIPMSAGAAWVSLSGVAVPALIPVLVIALVAAALAYVLAIAGARHLGATVSSFVGLTEVLFAIAFAWLLLGELPGAIQVVGGAIMLVGVIAVRLGVRTRSVSDAEPLPLPELDAAAI